MSDVRYPISDIRYPTKKRTANCQPPCRLPTCQRSRIQRVPAASITSGDLGGAARRRLPRSVFDYIDGGAEGEVTLRENVRAFEDITFRPRCAVDTAAPDLRTTVLGTPVSMPVILAPVGSSRMFWPRGEEVAARVAG